MKIAIFEPSSPSNPKVYSKGIEILKAELYSLEGIKQYGDFHLPNKDLPFLCGHDQQKAKNFIKALNGPESVIILTRGGYGSSRWLNLIPWKNITTRAYSKIVVGFSDATFISAALFANELRFIHGPMICTLANTSKPSRKALWNLLDTGMLPSLRGSCLVPGTTLGTLFGGNLSCLCHLIGTDIEPDWKGKILFLEDCNEPPYKIDRMLTHLNQAGVLSKVNGVALGDFTLKNAQEQKLLHNVFQDRLAHLKVPVGYRLPFGHGKLNFPLEVGANYILDCSNEDCFLAPG